MKLYCEFCRRIVDPAFEVGSVPLLVHARVESEYMDDGETVQLLLCGRCERAFEQHTQAVAPGAPIPLEQMLAFATGRAFNRGVTDAREELYERLHGRPLPKTARGLPNWDAVPDARPEAEQRPPLWNTTGYAANAEWKRTEWARRCRILR